MLIMHIRDWIDKEKNGALIVTKHYQRRWRRYMKIPKKMSHSLNLDGNKGQCLIFRFTTGSRNCWLLLRIVLSIPFLSQKQIGQIKGRPNTDSDVEASFSRISTKFNDCFKATLAHSLRSLIAASFFLVSSSFEYFIF